MFVFERFHSIDHYESDRWKLILSKKIDFSRKPLKWKKNHSACVNSVLHSLLYFSFKHISLSFHVILSPILLSLFFQLLNREYVTRLSIDVRYSNQQIFYHTV